jgi:hypothetical protein
MTEYTDEDKAELARFANMSEEDQQVALFDSLMNLLTDAVADNDMVMIKAYARLATESYNNYILPRAEEEEDDDSMGKV